MEKTGNEQKEENFKKAMTKVTKILALNDTEKPTKEIGQEMQVAEAYVSEVIAKGGDAMQKLIRKQYGLSEEVPTATPNESAPEPITNVTETAADKKKRETKEKADAKAVAKKAKDEAKANVPPKEKRTRELAILKALAEAPKGLTVEEVGDKARKILNIERKSWTGTLGQMKRDNEITYMKAAKKYCLPENEKNVVIPEPPVEKPKPEPAKKNKTEKDSVKSGEDKPDDSKK